MENEWGSVTLSCRKCKAVSVIDDAGSIEKMTGYQCPSCGCVMTGRELAWVKGMYYLKLSQGLKKDALGVFRRGFDCKIDLGVHFKK